MKNALIIYPEGERNQNSKVRSDLAASSIPHVVVNTKDIQGLALFAEAFGALVDSGKKNPLVVIELEGNAYDAMTVLVDCVFNKRVGDHKLPDDTKVIFTSESDEMLLTALPDAAKARMLHIWVEKGTTMNIQNLYTAMAGIRPKVEVERDDSPSP